MKQYRQHLLPSSPYLIDLALLIKQINKIKKFTREQREIYFENVRTEMKIPEEEIEYLIEIRNDLFANTDIESRAGLSFEDRTGENSQIIRVALLSYIEQELKRNK